MMRILLSVLCIGCVAVTHAGGMDFPGTIGHQGVIAVHGERFTGEGLFRFALVNPGNNKYLWVNDGLGAADPKPPTNPVTLGVVNGVYSVALGDTALANMTAIPPEIFNDADVWLRIWFDDAHGHGVHRLTPDIKIGAVPYALRLPNVTVDQATGNVGIGTTQPTATVHVEKFQESETLLKVLNPSTSPEAAAVIRVGNSDSAGLDIFRLGNLADIFLNASQGNGAIRFQDAGVDTVTIDQVGNVGIGTQTPTAQLEVQSTLPPNTQHGCFSLRDSDGSYLAFFSQDSSGNSNLDLYDGTGASTINLRGSGSNYINSGNVGIGTTSPSFKLDIAGDTGVSSNRDFFARYDSSLQYGASFGWDRLQLGNNGQNFIIAGRTTPGGRLHFVTNNTNAYVAGGPAPNGNVVMTLTESGNVGIGTTNPPPGTRLDVQGGNINTSGKVMEQSQPLIPAGAVMFFNATSCPAGWSEMTNARGRYVVGLQQGGSLGGTQGTTLGNLENRPVGQHTHGIIDPGHYHNGWNVLPFTGVGANIGGDPQNTHLLTATTGITIQNAGVVSGTNAPYIQLLVCVKN